MSSVCPYYNNNSYYSEWITSDDTYFSYNVLMFKNSDRLEFNKIS